MPDILAQSRGASPARVRVVRERPKRQIGTASMITKAWA